MTVADQEWDAIKGAFPSNFMTNQSDKFNAGEAWLNTMINRISLTRCYGVDYFNRSPFAKYNRGVVGVGDTVQAYKTKKIIPTKYDPNQTEGIFSLHKNPPIAQYNMINVAKIYEMSITAEQLIKAFTSQETLGDFMASQLSALSESDVLDQYTEWRQYISNVKPFVVRELGANEDLYETVRKLIVEFHTPSKDYNVAKDTVTSDMIDVILTEDRFLEIGSKLGGIYHPSYVALDNATITWVKDFASPDSKNKIEGIVVDERALNRWVRPPVTNSIQNPRAGFFNYTYKLESIYGVDTFRNAVMLISHA